MANPLRELARYGQSLWHDGFRREMLRSGQLARHVEEDGLCGLTTNPAIYQKAIVDTGDYDTQLAALLPRADLDAKAVYEELAVRDIRLAAELFDPVYRGTARRDGYVCLEVSPVLARDPDATMAEARRLWHAVGRENAMIKVPGTPEATLAIRQLLTEGINVNITLLFSRVAYGRSAEAYLSALEARADHGEDVSRVASVASFFVSRIDSMVDRMLDELSAAAETEALRRRVEAVRGRVAIANARLAYQDYKAIVAGPRWARLRQLGARPQRLLWGSTSTKDPRYLDVMYPEALIGPDTVDTMPPETFAAFRDHGRVGPTLDAEIEAARATLAELPALGISLEQVTDRLLADGVRLFAEPFAGLLAAIDARRGAGAGAGASA